jgi:hypothetical protein
MTKGADQEVSSVAFTIANGGITSGLKLYAFLTSSAVNLGSGPIDRHGYRCWISARRISWLRP